MLWTWSSDFERLFKAFTGAVSGFVANKLALIWNFQTLKIIWVLNIPGYVTPRYHVQSK